VSYRQKEVEAIKSQEANKKAYTRTEAEYEALERQLAEYKEEGKLKKDLISQVSKICLLLQMGKLPSQEDFKELMSLERAYRTFEEQFGQAEIEADRGCDPVTGL